MKNIDIKLIRQLYIISMYNTRREKGKTSNKKMLLLSGTTLIKALNLMIEYTS